MRNLSFALTTRQFRERTKTVTRRVGTTWAKRLKPGDLLCGVVKSQGIPKGGKVDRLGVIRVVSVRVERLARITNDPMFAFIPEYGSTFCHETVREGFPGLTAWAFVQMFCKHMKCKPSDEITRIEFAYVDGPTS